VYIENKVDINIIIREGEKKMIKEFDPAGIVDLNELD